MRRKKPKKPLSHEHVLSLNVYTSCEYNTIQLCTWYSYNCRILRNAYTMYKHIIIIIIMCM